MTDRITIRKPDDWHLHVRDGEMLQSVMHFTARHFGRAIIMPNLVPPVTSIADALAYRERVMAAVPEGSTFQPLMTCYMTDETDPDEVERGFRDGVFTGVKLYPVGATTNSAFGVTDFEKIRPVLARMEKIGMRLLIHGEEAADPAVDVFDREAVFIERRLEPMTRDYRGNTPRPSERPLEAVCERECGVSHEDDRPYQLVLQPTLLPHVCLAMPESLAMGQLL